MSENNKKDYSQYKLDTNKIISEARMRCMREMYAKAQPSADYDDIYAYYQECSKNKAEPEKIYNRHYLSYEEYNYILNKYVEAYRLKDQFKDDCDIIIRDMKEGCLKDKYISEITDERGIYHPGYRSSEKVPCLSKQIGEENAQKVINFINHRRDYYRFDYNKDQFIFSISLQDSPNTNLESVKEYWKSKGVELDIDPRHHDTNYFWCEENGYWDEDEEDS